MLPSIAIGYGDVWIVTSLKPAKHFCSICSNSFTLQLCSLLVRLNLVLFLSFSWLLCIHCSSLSCVDLLLLLWQTGHVSGDLGFSLNMFFSSWSVSLDEWWQEPCCYEFDDDTLVCVVRWMMEGWNYIKLSPSKMPQHSIRVDSASDDSCDEVLLSLLLVQLAFKLQWMM